MYILLQVVSANIRLPWLYDIYFNYHGCIRILLYHNYYDYNDWILDIVKWCKGVYVK